MTNLRKFTFSYDKGKDDWALTEQGASRATKRFKTKTEATKKGVLSNALGKKGGSVRIKKQDGKI